MSALDLQDELQPKKAAWLSFLEDVAEGGIYNDAVEKMIQTEGVRIMVNINDVRRQNPDLAENLRQTPMLDITAAELALKELVDTKDAAYSLSRGKFFVGFTGSFGGHHVTPRGLSARLLGKLVCIDGIVSRCSLIHPKVVKSVHYCPQTEKSLERAYRDATSLDGLPTYGLYPKQDENGHPLVTEFGYSIFKNHQKLTIQEMPERAPTGQLPRSVEVVLDDDLVDQVKPGDRVRLVGVYRALPSKRNGSTSGVFKTVLIGNSVQLLGDDPTVPDITAEDITAIRKLARDKKWKRSDKLFSLLAQSLAPSIYGHAEIKKGLLCLLLGGEEKNLKRGGHIRGDINVLLVGDPSCGKSQLLRFVQNTAPHVITTTGRGSSGVGLTAAVTTDSDTGERRLEAGAMVLADRGIVCIDEFDKMSDIDRVSMHEVMEQQTVTIAKAGIHTSLNARCSVLAAANPVYGQYDPFRSATHNIGLPDSLLSRFDLLFIVLDKMDPEIDQKLAAHVLKSHLYRKSGEKAGAALRVETSNDVIISEAPEEEDEEKHKNIWVKMRGRRSNARSFLTVDFVKKYVTYAKMRCHPKLGQDAADMIAEKYSNLRSRERDEKTLPVTARTLETMIRLSTAFAKARLSATVDKKDAESALRLVNFAYYNDAQPLDKPKKKRHDDSSSDEDSDEELEDDNDDNNSSSNAPGTGGSNKKKKAASSSSSSTPQRKKPKTTSQASDSQQQQASQRAFSRKKSSTTTAESYDPYEFDAEADADADGGEAAQKRPKLSQKERDGGAKGKQKPKSKKKVVDDDDGDDDDDDNNGNDSDGDGVGTVDHTATSQEASIGDAAHGQETEEVEKDPISAEEMSEFRAAFLSVFKKLRKDTVSVSDLQAQLEALGVSLDTGALRDRLDVMVAKNEVYVADDMVIRI